MSRKGFNVYRVLVTTTNGSGNTTEGPDPTSDSDAYRDCEHGELYVITDDPKKIYDEFMNVVSVARIGVGYALLER